MANDYKKLIYFRDSEYQTAYNQFKLKEKLQKELIEELNILGLTLPASKQNDFLLNPERVLLELIEDNYKDRNQLKLSTFKLIELLEINLTNFKKLLNSYTPLITLEKPVKESFSIYTNSEIEVKRLEAIETILEAIEPLSEFTQIRYGNLIQALNNTIIYDHTSNKLLPNIHFIKNSFR